MTDTQLRELRELGYGMSVGNLNPDDVSDYMAIASACARMESRRAAHRANIAPAAANEPFIGAMHNELTEAKRIIGELVWQSDSTPEQRQEFVQRAARFAGVTVPVYKAGEDKQDEQSSLTPNVILTFFRREPEIGFRMLFVFTVGYVWFGRGASRFESS